MFAVKSPYECTSASLLSTMMRRNPEITRTAVSCAQTVGTFLSRLAAKDDGRVTKKVSHNHRISYTLDLTK
jgi:hypothetical protein